MSQVGVGNFDLLEELGVLFCELFTLGFLENHHTGGFLRFGGSTQLHAATHINIRDAAFLTQHGNVTYHVNGIDVSSQNANTGDSLANGLDDLLDASLQFPFVVD